MASSQTSAMALATPGTTATSSVIIANLAARQSVLTGESPYDRIARAVLTQSKSSAQAELRVKRLTAKAKSKNWLPELRPGVSLTSLGELVTSMVFEQVLFDNGAKKAEREYAAADVEIAAVNLSEDYNNTVYDGLAHYVQAQQAAAQADVAEMAQAWLAKYDRIMMERVRGGLSDMSEKRVILQKLSEMEATAATDRDTARGQMAQLAAMAGGPMGDLSGVPDITIPTTMPVALSVERAMGEKSLIVAEAKVARAGLLPSLTAGASVGAGKPDYALDLGVTTALGLGTGDQLSALDAAKRSAEQNVEEARQDAQQEVVRLQSKLERLEAKRTRDGQVVAEMEQSLTLYTEQYRLGGRSLMELVTQFESYADMKRAHAGLKFDIALIKLEIARQHGILVEGEII
ncbi:hypothetical protein BFP70_15315 [Thioclava sp. SK-1]|nr:hypothetical protein BFP70_15315 [Thioclava sp. SK-1]